MKTSSTKSSILLIVCYLLFSLTNSLNAKTSKSSVWFPAQAQWYYSTHYGCVNVVVFGDTLFEGNLCKELRISKCEEIDQYTREYVYPSGDSLFYYNFASKKFFLLMDMSAQTGDTIWVHKEPYLPNPGFDPYKSWEGRVDEAGWDKVFPSLGYVITKTDTCHRGGRVLRRQYTENLEKNNEGSCWTFPFAFDNGLRREFQGIIEGIGSMSSFFGELKPWYPEWRASFITCFFSGEDAWIGGDKDCNYHISVEELQKQEKVQWKLFPQPANDVVVAVRNTSANIAVEENRGIYTLYDNSGRKLTAGSFTGTSFEVNVSGYNKGMYFIEIKEENNGNIIILKCLK